MTVHPGIHRQSRRRPAMQRALPLAGAALALLLALSACSPFSSASDRTGAGGAEGADGAASIAGVKTGVVRGAVTSSDPGHPVSAGAVGVGLYDSAQVRAYSGEVDAAGAFEIKGVTPGVYTVFFTGGAQYADEWFDGAANQADAKPVTVASARSTIVAAELLSTPSGTLSGTARALNPSGADFVGLAGVRVEAHDAAGHVESVFADASGRYSFSALTTGEYALRFVPPADRPDLVDEWFEGASDVTGARRLTVSAGVAQTSIDVVLSSSAKGSLSGRVTSPPSAAGGSDALADAEVRAFNAAGAVWSVRADVSGAFLFPALIPGDYSLQFIPPSSRKDLAEEWYSDMPDRKAANTVAVSSGHRTESISAQLLADPTAHVWQSIATPKLIGDARVGRNIGVDVGSWLPEPGYAYFQWKRDDGKRLTAFTFSSDWIPSSDDVGHTLTVTWSVQRPGMPDRNGTLTTAPIRN